MMASDYRRLLLLLFVLLCLCLCTGTFAKQNSWKTLDGKTPLVIARGGMSGLFPDYSDAAYIFALNNSLYDVVIFCDLQLTKDAQGICRTNLQLENSTNIIDVYPNKTSNYLVNGKNTKGYFGIDFAVNDLFGKVSAIQSLSYRTSSFDANFGLLGPEDLSGYQAAIWLNVQYSKFYDELNYSIPSYVRSLSRKLVFNYISSVEVGFLRAIAPNLRTKRTKLILKFMKKEDIDPSTNETYGSILRNLTFVKTIADGILVPKSYIWPIGTDGYLQPPTNLVKDAHNEGLEIFASDFSNDEYSMSYNYSYDPIREYLQFVDNNNFAVDGVLTDFPVTASEAIACYAHNNAKISSRAGNPLIITHNGASGDYPGCTDMSYEAAIRDGADYIDCSVQITNDGIPFCRESPDLLIGTTITSNSVFYPSRLKKIPAVQTNEGIFTFDLTWEEIQGLQPYTYSPYSDQNGDGYQLLRNPAQANVGKYMNLADFLEMAKKQANVSVLINIENARALISERNLDVTNATLSALKMSGYDKISDRIRIQSDDSAVLVQFKQKTNFKLIFKVDKPYVVVNNTAINEVKRLADTVALSRSVIFWSSKELFLLNATTVVSRFHSHNMSVFAYTLRNEFPYLAFDFLADPTMEINTYAQVAKVDGIITEFPATATAYLRNPCIHPRSEDDYPMLLVNPGELYSTIPKLNKLPPEPSAGPLPPVVEPPLPPLMDAPAPQPVSDPPGSSKSPSGGASHIRPSLFVSLLIGALLLFLNS